MSNPADDEVFVTKLCIPFARTNQLVSAIKPEPQEYENFDNNCTSIEPPRKILPAVSIPSGTTGPTLLPSSTVYHSRPSSLDVSAAIPNRSVQSGVAVTGVGSHNIATQINATVSAGQQTAPPIGHVSSAATLLSHPSVAVPNLTAITPLLVSNLTPSDLRKPPESMNNPNLLPTLINSSAQSTFGLINPCHFTEHNSYSTHSHVHPVPHTVIANPNARLNVFTQLVSRSSCPTSNTITSGLSGPVSFTSIPMSTHPGRNLLATGSGAGGVSATGIHAPIRPRFSSPALSTWPSNAPTSTVNLLPKMAIPSGVGPIPPAPQYTHRGTVSGASGGVGVLRHGPEYSTATAMTNVTVVQAQSTAQLQYTPRTLYCSTEASRQAMTNEARYSAASSVSVPVTRAPGKIQPAETNNQSPVSSPCLSGSVNETDLLLWGRLVRLSDGSVHFPGLGRLLFSSPQSVLRQIRRIASSEESLSLQLPPLAVDMVPVTEARINNWLGPTSTELGSRKGFHVCLCCQQAFSNRALFDSHMKRPVARILYRCHLCRGSESAHLPPPIATAIATTSASNGPTNLSTHNLDSESNSIGQNNCGTSSTIVHENTERSNDTDNSPYCTVLPGGIIKAPNRCAIYSHMACMHSNHPISTWTLLPALLTICPLSESAWSMPSFQLSRHFNVSEVTTTSVSATSTSVTVSTQASDTTTQPADEENRLGTTSTLQAVQYGKTPEDTGPAAVSNGSGTTVTATSTGADQNGTPGGAADIFTQVESEDQPTFYQSGMELTELWCDFERALNEAVSYQPLDFLTSSAYHSDGLRFRLSSDADDYSPYGLWRSSLVTNPAMGSALNFHLSHSHHASRNNSDTSAIFPLPDPESPLAQTILLSAGADLWKSHLFLSAWCQQNRPVLTQMNGSGGPIVIGEDDEEDLEQREATTDVPVSPASEDPIRAPDSPAPGPSPNELNGSLNQLDRWVVPAESNSTKSEKTAADGQSHSITNPLPVKGDVESGLLRCLICNFRANTPGELQHHLSGAQPFTLTKCALCGQAVCVRQPNLCAVKAHLLLHLDCFLMCPQCGFTPPPHFTPDSAELCLRIHLRFVCFHYNVLQVYLCTRCQGQGKAFHSLTNLCHHYFDRHSVRVYACLWCARQTGSQIPARTESTTGVTSISNGSDSRTPNGTVDTTADGLDGCRSLNGPSSDTPTTTSHTPERSGTPPQKPSFSLANTRELLLHMRNSHRKLLILPSSTGPSGAATTTTSTISTADNTTPVATVAMTIANTTTSLRQGTTTDSLPTQPVCDGELLSSEIDRLCTPTLTGRCSVDSNASTEKRSSTGSVVGTGNLNSTDPPTSTRSGDVQAPLCLLPSVDFSCGYKCSECNQVFDNRDAFSRHFRVRHPWGYSAVCCYRCFGSCKRLSYKLDEFRRHAAVCGSARRMFMHTFASSASRVNSESREHPASSNVTNCSPSGSPLCFCSYCGIGARRVDNPSVLTCPPVQASSPGSPGGSPAELVIDERDADNPQPARAPSNPPPSSTDSLVLLPSQSAAKEPVYKACYFNSLANVHAHESQNHGFENNSQIACPWCGHRLSCYKRHDLHFTIQHLRTHLRRHHLTSWTMERKKRWDKRTADLPLCSCGSALLDSPLALASHCSAHLLARNPLLARQNCCSSNPYLTSGTSTSQPGQPDRDRLRFAEFPELDYYLSSTIAEPNQPFICPVCRSPTPTRWALTEHAFVEHWGVLCYICCSHIMHDSARPGAPIYSSRMHQPLVPSGHHLPTDTKLLSPTKMHPPEELSPHSVLSADVNNADPMNDKGNEDCTTTVNFWDHLFHCLQDRGRAVRRARRQTLEEAENSDCLVTHYPSMDFSDDHTVECDTTTVTRNQRQTKNIESQSVRGSPIVIASSPESPRSPDEKIGSPQPDDPGHEDEQHSDPPLSCSTLGTTPARASPLRIDCPDEADPELDTSTNRVARPHSTDIVSDTAQAFHSGEDSAQPLHLPASFAKRRRLSIERSDVSPVSSLFSETSDIRPVDEGYFAPVKICVLCGEPQTPDTWDEHQLSHRNPHMTWNGLELSNPNRIVLAPRRTKVYRCYICNSRFVSRYSCRRHLTTTHGLDKTQVNWDLLSETTTTPAVSAPNETSQTRSGKVTNRSKPSTPRRRTLPSTAADAYSSVPDPTSSTRVHLLRSQTGAIRKSVNPTEDCVTASTNGAQQQQYRCVQCAIHFMSQRSLTIHRLAAHGSSD
ncbi:hypothetical protein FGIG_03675 [Fasciola gigantica]|uniref:C2H2-type domain-containing protein n=1 Tax=Fasciola gigantica TaxID=46835 RepID=A0A504Z2K8_FASGI|nr:hypothetical protein FGIG_03675 [Fasciola gigantica]